MKHHFSVLFQVSHHIGKLKIMEMYTLVKKNRVLSIINKLHLKSDVIDGSVVNSFRKPIHFGFVLHKVDRCLDKLSGNKVFCEPEPTQYKK